MTSPRHLRLLLLVLPLVLARMVLPAGFMPMVQDGEVRLAFCGSLMALPGEDGSQADPQPLDGNDHCPFAQPAMALLPVLPVEPPSVPVVVPPPAAAVQFQPATGPPRALGSRAPPVSFSA